MCERLTAKIKDIRVREYHSIDSNKEYPVYTYLQEERETHCSYVAEEDKWIIDTTVGKHITKLMKIRNADITVESVTESGTITAITAVVGGNQVLFSNRAEKKKEEQE